MKKYQIIILFLIFVSCASENQQRGLEVIAKYYDTDTSFSKGFSTNAGKTRTKFTIKVGGSELLDTLQTDLASSNIALMLFDSFSAEEREEYTHIEVEMEADSLKETQARLYEPIFLEKGLDQVAIFENFSDNLLAKNYSAIAANVEPKYQNPQLASNLGNFMNTLHQQHGSIVDYKRVEFGIFTKKNGEKLFHYSGHLTFSDGYTRPYFMTTSQDVKNDFIAGYKLD